MTLGDKGGGGSQKSQNRGDVLYGQPLIIEYRYYLIPIYFIVVFERNLKKYNIVVKKLKTTVQKCTLYVHTKIQMVRLITISSEK